MTAGYDTAADRIARGCGIAQVFRVTRAIGVPRRISHPRDTVVVPPASRVFVVAGIARPDRFVADVASAGWDISGVMQFHDHHPFDARDVARIAAEARAKGSAIVLTTEKDAVRLSACDLGDLPIAAVPLDVGVEPADVFRAWLLERLAVARSAIAQSPIRNQSAIRNPQSATER